MTTLFCEFGIFLLFLSCLVVLHFEVTEENKDVEVTEENEDVEVTEKNEVATNERVSSPFLFTWNVIIYVGIS